MWSIFLAILNINPKRHSLQEARGYYKRSENKRRSIHTNSFGLSDLLQIQTHNTYIHIYDDDVLVFSET